MKFQLHVYINQSEHRTDETFEFFRDLYKENLVTQVTFNTNDSTFNAFSKAVACNQFGLNHEQDPLKDTYDFLLMLDNDMIVAHDWDVKLKKVWNHVREKKMKSVKVVTQIPGGSKGTKLLDKKIIGCNAKLGHLGGSGFWCVQPNFFRDIGYLDVPPLVGHNKKHDQHYWRKLQKKTGGNYVLSIGDIFAYHTGSIAGSICNRLTRNKNYKSNDCSKTVEVEKRIDALVFDDFYKEISDPKKKLNRW